jgi:mRNA interferase MazF
MKRGEVWTLQDDEYASKARPVVIVQSDLGGVFDSIVLCLFTTFESSHIPARVPIASSKTNGLKKDSFVMTEKLITVDKRELGEKIGALTEGEMHQIARQLAKLLEIRKKVERFPNVSLVERLSSADSFHVDISGRGACASINFALLSELPR